MTFCKPANEGEKTACTAGAPLDIVQAQQVEHICVGRRLVEVHLDELHRVGVHARHGLADVRQDVVLRILLSPAQHNDRFRNSAATSIASESPGPG